MHSKIKSCCCDGFGRILSVLAVTQGRSRCSDMEQVPLVFRCIWCRQCLEVYSTKWFWWAAQRRDSGNCHVANSSWPNDRQEFSNVLSAMFQKLCNVCARYGRSCVTIMNFLTDRSQWPLFPFRWKRIDSAKHKGRCFHWVDSRHFYCGNRWLKRISDKNGSSLLTPSNYSKKVKLRGCPLWLASQQTSTFIRQLVSANDLDRLRIDSELRPSQISHRIKRCDVNWMRISQLSRHTISHTKVLRTSRRKLRRNCERNICIVQSKRIALFHIWML